MVDWLTQLVGVIATCGNIRVPLCNFRYHDDANLIDLRYTGQAGHPLFDHGFFTYFDAIMHTCFAFIVNLENG